MARSRISRQPSPYPALAFHGLRVAQIVSSIIVMSILGYFIHHLSLEQFAVPWTFILLITVSVFTIATIVATYFFYHQRTLRPQNNSLINIGLTTLWALGLGLLCWNLSGTLGHVCKADSTWQNETGIMVCRLYKALASFTIIAMATTVMALLLDVHIGRKVASRGTYNNMHDIKAPAALSRVNLNREEFAADEEQAEADHEREPSLEYPAYSHEVKKAYRVQEPMEAQQFGYAAPTEQTAYDGPSSAFHGDGA